MRKINLAEIIHNFRFRKEIAKREKEKKIVEERQKELKRDYAVFQFMYGAELNPRIKHYIH